MSTRQNEVTLRYEDIDRQTDLAWGVTINGTLHWFPKSRCSVSLSDRIIIVPRWLLSRKGIIQSNERFAWLGGI